MCCYVVGFHFMPKKNAFAEKQVDDAKEEASGFRRTQAFRFEEWRCHKCPLAQSHSPSRHKIFCIHFFPKTFFATKIRMIDFLIRGKVTFDIVVVLLQRSMVAPVSDACMLPPSARCTVAPDTRHPTPPHNRCLVRRTPDRPPILQFNSTS